MTGKLSDSEERVIDTIKRTFELPDAAEVEVDEESLKNAGFCSILKTVRLNRKFDVVLKCAPAGREIREAIPFERIFRREIYFYETVIPTFRRLQEDNGCNEVWDCVPRCFYGSTEVFHEIVVLENLKAQDFALWPRSKEMDGEHLRLVLEEYAKFHALSFALRVHKPIELQNIEENTEDVYLPVIKKCGTAETIRNLSSRVFKAYGANFFGDIIEIMEALTSKGAAGNYAVLCHGDTWCNNMLFKYKNKKPITLKLIDFQLVRFGSPVLDLSYFLYTSASLSDLKNLDQLLRHYHDTLSRFLKQFRCDFRSVFPYEVLEEHWRKFAKFGLGMAFLVVNVMMMDESELPDVNDDRNGEDFIGSFEKPSKNDERYLQRMMGILQHFTDKRLL